jgi:hypothetical protein
MRESDEICESENAKLRRIKVSRKGAKHGRKGAFASFFSLRLCVKLLWLGFVRGDVML